MSQSILTNTTIATLGRVANLVLGFIVIAFVTRRLGLDRFGDYSLVLAYGIILQLVADMGLYLTLNRELGHTTTKPASFIAEVISLRLVLLVLVLGVGGLLFVIWPTRTDLSWSFLIAAVGLFCQSISQLLMAVYQVHGVVWRATVGDLVGRLIQVAAVIYLFAGTTTGMVLAFTAGSVAALGIHAWLLPVKAIWRWSYNQVTWRRLLQVSWPLGLMLLMNAIYFRIDTVILAHWRSPAEVGQYGLAYKVIESALFFPAMFGGLLLPPLAVVLKKPSKIQAQQLFNQALHLLVVLALLALFVLEVTAPWLLAWLSGPAFIGAAPLLQILALALAIMFLGNLFGYVLVALERQQVLLWLYIGLAVGNTAANWWLVPQYGAAAAAWITVVTEGIAMSVAGYIVNQHLPLQFSIRRAIGLAVTVMVTLGVLAVIPTHWPMIIRLIVLVTVYISVALSLGVMRWRDLSLLTTRPL